MFVVAGVTGKTGRVVAEALLGAGKRVRVLVRDPAGGAAWRSRGAEVAVAALDDHFALARALEGAAGAYLLSPQDPTSTDPIGDGRRIADAIARAVERARVPHLVMLSSLGAHHSEGTGLAVTLHAAEQRLRDTPAAVTFVRAAYFLEGWAPVLGRTAAGKLPTFVSPDLVIPMVSSRDIGGVAARALLEGPPATSREVIELSGPGDVSPRDLAGVLSRLLGHPVEPEPLALEAVIPFLTGFGASAAFADQVRQLYQAINEGKIAGPDRGARVVRGSVDAEAVFRSLLAPAGPS